MPGTWRKHFQWGLLPGHSANTATSPLNVVILALASKLSGGIMHGLALVTVLEGMLLALGLRRLGQQWSCGGLLSWIATPILLSAPLVAATVGMETLLAIVLAIWMIERAGSGSPQAFGWLAGAALVTRADLLVVVAVIWLVHPALRRPLLRRVAGVGWRAAVVSAPWYIFSWVHFGSAIPDTLAIKQAVHGHDFLVRPYVWLTMFPVAGVATLLVVIAGMVAGLLFPVLFRTDPPRSSWKRALVPLLVGVAYYLTFLTLKVPGFTWYYGLPLASCVVTLSAVLARVIAKSGPLDRRRAVAAAVLTLVGLAPNAIFWATRPAYPMTSAPIYGNWATTAQYRTIGMYLHGRFAGTGVGIHSAGEFGEMLFYCQCKLIDKFDSRQILHPLLERQESSGPLMRLNYTFYRPSQYLAIPYAWRLRFSRTQPPTEPRWRVETPLPRRRLVLSGQTSSCLSAPRWAIPAHCTVGDARHQASGGWSMHAPLRTWCEQSPRARRIAA